KIDLPTLESLKENGFDVNQTDKYGNPPLYYALARNPDLEIAKKLIEYGADVNKPAKNGVIPLNIATSRANELQLQIMMMKSFKPEVQQLKNMEELKKYVFLEMTEAIEMAQLLIDSGADVNLVSSLGTPLMNAVTNVWNLDIVKMFIEAGADLNATDATGKTALFYASASSNDEAVNLLIENGADTTIKDVDGKIYSQMEKVNVEPAI
ncbi:MAG: ankyrin repeat domain-containing protein, partial [Alphaproteobacteria bacterium]|nr:ankyrin repeat domain-containing protein [Alphaproteobacteria bacterium]